MTKYAAGACWVLGLWLGHIAPVPAATVQRDYLDHGGTTCRGARPVDNDSLQFTPKGVRNTGSKSVYVTCDFDVGPNVPNLNPAVGIDAVSIAFLNLTSSDADVRCTQVSGILHVTTSSSKSTVAAAPQNGGAAGVLSWTAEFDNGGERIPAPALSCLLPASIEVAYTFVRTTEDVGQ
jgi:hypothetical protein